MHDYDRRKTASGGPVGQILDKIWHVTDALDSEFHKAISEYDKAAMYADKPASKDAKDVIAKLQKLHKDIEHLTSTAMHEVAAAERHFMEKHGSPDEYVRGLREAAAHQDLDPSKPLEGNAVAYFTVGGDERDGDPESIALQKGHVPVQEVMKYLHKRMPNSKTQPGHHPGEIVVHDIAVYDKSPYTYTTQVKVKSRK